MFLLLSNTAKFVFSCFCGVSQNYSWECFSREVSLQDFNPALSFWTRQKENAPKVSWLQQLRLYPLLASDQPSESQDTKKSLQEKKPKTKQTQKPNPKPQTLACYFSSITFPDFGQRSHNLWEETNGSCYLHLLWRAGHAYSS